MELQFLYVLSEKNCVLPLTKLASNSLETLNLRNRLNLSSLNWIVLFRAVSLFGYISITVVSGTISIPLIMVWRLMTGTEIGTEKR